MTIRQFFGKARQKVIRILLGRELFTNLFNLKKAHEDITYSKTMMSENIEKIKQTLFRMENNEKSIVDMINRVNANINTRHGQLWDHIKNKHADIIGSLLKKTDGLRKTTDEKVKELEYKIQKYAPEDKYPEILGDLYRERKNKKLDLTNPRTFNEKIQWLKLYDSTPLKTRLADKFLVREWVKEKIDGEYLIPLLGVYNTFDEIDFDALPGRFVLKANHGCGYNIIVTDKLKLDREKAKKDMDSWMRTNYAYKYGYELQYRDIEPKIIAEQYLENSDGDLYDYKVFCFDGKAKYIMFLSERSLGLKMAFYDTEWNLQPFSYTYPRNDKVVPKPACLDTLIMLSEKLSNGFPHVRVDFYVLDDGSIKFGEMTFTSASGQCKWDPSEWDLMLGDMIKLPVQA